MSRNNFFLETKETKHLETTETKQETFLETKETKEETFKYEPFLETKETKQDAGCREITFFRNNGNKTGCWVPRNSFLETTETKQETFFFKQKKPCHKNTSL